MDCEVALCGLTARDSRMLEIVINRASSERHRFQAVQAGKSGAPQIAVVDAASAASLTLYQDLKQRNPQLVPVTISDHGMAGDSRYRIERRSLFTQIMRVLETLADTEFSGNKISTHPAAGASRTAAPAPVLTHRQTEPEVAFVTGADAHPLTALVVDDSATVREQLRQALQRLGIACDQADSAEAATPLLEQHSYCLVFLDVMMPGADGFELCRWIRRNAYTRLLPVLMLTSRDSPLDRSRGELSGCDVYLTKPITWAIFSQAVDQVLMKYFQNDRAQLITRGYRN